MVINYSFRQNIYTSRSLDQRLIFLIFEVLVGLKSNQGGITTVFFHEYL